MESNKERAKQVTFNSSPVTQPMSELEIDSESDREDEQHKMICVSSEHILNGSYGPHIDKYLGKSPVDGPPGYKLMRLRYKTPANAATSLVATYRRGPLHRGIISMLNGGVRTNKNINEDQQGGAGIATEIKLVDGDIVLAAILTMNDGRNYNQRQGTFAAGITPISSTVPLAANIHYGVFATDNSQPIVATALGGGTTVSCASTKKIACCHPNFVVYNPHHVHAVATDEILSEPALSISANSFVAAGDATSMEVELTVYALVGPRVTGFTSMNTIDLKFRLSDLCKIHTHTTHVSI